MSSSNSSPNWSDPAMLAALDQAFNAIWSAICASKDSADKSRIAELSMAVSVQLAAGGVNDPQEHDPPLNSGLTDIKGICGPLRPGP